MRDIDALLNSIINIDRNSLIAILACEAEAAWQLVSAARERTASQRAKRRDAEQRAERVDRMLSFFQHGDVAPGMSRHDIELCRSLEQNCTRGANAERFERVSQLEWLRGLESLHLVNHKGFEYRTRCAQ